MILITFINQQESRVVVTCVVLINLTENKSTKMPILVNNNEFFYFKLNRYYDENCSTMLPDHYKVKNTLFWVRKDTMTKDKLKSFLEGEKISLHLEDNYYGINFDSTFFDIIDKESARKHLDKMISLDSTDNDEMPF
jgi:hypothetical protein